MIEEIKKELEKHADLSKAKVYAGFFKTGKGEYGEGDVFLGLTAPTQRAIAKKYLNLELKDIQKLLSSEIHEFRLTGLIILVEKYKKSEECSKEYIEYLKESIQILSARKKRRQ